MELNPYVVLAIIGVIVAAVVIWGIKRPKRGDNARPSREASDERDR